MIALRFPRDVPDTAFEQLLLACHGWLGSGGVWSAPPRLTFEFTQTGAGVTVAALVSEPRLADRLGPVLAAALPGLECTAADCPAPAGTHLVRVSLGGNVGSLRTALPRPGLAAVLAPLAGAPTGTAVQLVLTARPEQTRRLLTRAQRLERGGRKRPRLRAPCSAPRRVGRRRGRCGRRPARRSTQRPSRSPHRPPPPRASWRPHRPGRRRLRSGSRAHRLAALARPLAGAHPAPRLAAAAAAGELHRAGRAAGHVGRGTAPARDRHRPDAPPSRPTWRGAAGPGHRRRPGRTASGAQPRGRPLSLGPPRPHRDRQVDSDGGADSRRRKSWRRSGSDRPEG